MTIPSSGEQRHEGIWLPEMLSFPRHEPFCQRCAFPARAVQFQDASSRWRFRGTVIFGSSGPEFISGQLLSTRSTSSFFVPSFTVMSEPGGKPSPAGFFSMNCSVCFVTPIGFSWLSSSVFCGLQLSLSFFLVVFVFTCCQGIVA